jgi:hypothetical protein
MDGQSVELVPGYPQLKLSLEAADALGIDRSALVVLDAQEEKQGYRLGQDCVAQPLPLSRIYVVTEAGPPDHVRLGDQQAVIELVRHSIPTRFAQSGNERHFLGCIELSRRVPIFSVRRAGSLRELAEAARRLEEHALSGG